MIRLFALVMALCPVAAFAEVKVTNAYVPLAPKGVMAHAAYMELTNTGAETRSLIGLTAKAYAMSHLHQSADVDGIATMTAMHQLDIKPGQTVTLAPGGLHVMLMQPSAPLAQGATVALQLNFANGETVSVDAKVVRLDGSS